MFSSQFLRDFAKVLLYAIQYKLGAFIKQRAFRDIDMKFIKKILICFVFLCASISNAAEFEVMDKFTVNGVTHLKSSATIIVPDTVPASIWISTSVMTPHLYVSTAGNVGISTGSPQGRLDVIAGGLAASDMVQIWRRGDGVIVGSMSATGIMQAVKFLGDASGMTGLGDDLGNHIATTTLNMADFDITNVSSMNITAAGLSGSQAIFKIAGSTMVVLNSGNIGIGTDNPGSKLHIEDSTTETSLTNYYNALTLQLRQSNSTANTMAGIRWVASSGNDAAAIVTQITDHTAASVNGDIHFMTNYNGTAATTKMTIKDDGNVGIGIVVPTAKLHIEAYEAGKYTMQVSTSSTAGHYSIAVSSEGLTNVNNLVIENRTSDPVSPVTGQIWLRVD